jgi:pimeloyl-ACP methyl ester carboxylesterase
VSTYILVPGAWLGSWAWKGVARRLREAGSEVYSITLTGLADRVHLARRDVNLETHITDVIKLLEYEDLDGDVVLVGHSYAGIIVAGVADRAGHRLSHVVYVDTGPLDDGQSMLDFAGPDEVAEIERQVAEAGDGWLYPYPGFERLGPPPMLEGLGPSQRALLDRKSTPQPFGTYEQPLRLAGDGRGDFQRVLVACNGFRFIEKILPTMSAFLTPEWKRIDVQTGHWPMLSAPDALAAELLGLGR